MAIQEKYIDLIDGYLDGSLEVDEKSLFEKELKINEELEEALKVRMKLKEVWRDTKEYEETMKMIKTTINVDGAKRKPRQLWYVFSAAASIALLVGSYFFINSQFVQQDQLKDELVNNQTNEELPLLQMDEPISYAKIDSIGKIDLVSPKNKQLIAKNRNITFYWKTASSILDTICIHSLKNDSLFYSLPVRLSDSVQVLKDNKLALGMYYWKLKSQNEKGVFIIH